MDSEKFTQPSKSNQLKRQRDRGEVSDQSDPGDRRKFPKPEISLEQLVEIKLHSLVEVFILFVVVVVRFVRFAVGLYILWWDGGSFIVGFGGYV